ncbi:MAG: serine hydrolase domain-containing protein [Candidatus Odinarchaeota archaeon]
MKQKSHFMTLFLSLIIVASGAAGGILWLNLYTLPAGETRLLELSTPEEQGMDGAKVNQVIRWIEEHDYAVDSLVIACNGKIVVEKHFSLGENLNLVLPDGDSKHQICSCTKSLVSALTGIAIEKGYIESVNQKVVDFFPGRTIANLDSRKQDLTVEDLLTMRTGFDWWQPFSTSPDFKDRKTDPNLMYANPDWTQYALDRPMACEPGMSWVYCEGASHLLSAIIEQTTGKSTLAFAREFLFEPLGITDVYWPKAAEGVYYGGTGVYMKTRDMVKLGILYLNNGSWNGQQVLPAEWVVNSTRTYHSFWENSGYGYQWWTFPESKAYSAIGGAGQRIFVVPEHDLVVVLTGDIYGLDPQDGLLQHILSATDEPEIYSGYGFSFSYSDGMIIEERTDIVGVISNTSGQIDANTRMFPLLKYTVVWDTMESVSNLATVLDDHIKTFEVRNPHITYTRIGSLVTSMKDNHELLYQEFEMIEQGTMITGVICCWYCEESSRIYICLYYDLDSGLIENFKEFVTSFICH